jgi:hypothetical protein
MQDLGWCINQRKISCSERESGEVQGLEINFGSKFSFNYPISIWASILIKLIYIFIIYYNLDVDFKAETKLKIKVDPKFLGPLQIPPGRLQQYDYFDDKQVDAYGILLVIWILEEQKKRWWLIYCAITQLALTDGTFWKCHKFNSGAQFPHKCLKFVQNPWVQCIYSTRFALLRFVAGLYIYRGWCQFTWC